MLGGDDGAKEGKRADPGGVVSNDGSVEGSLSRSTSNPGSSNKDLESNIYELSEDWETKEDEEKVEGVRPNELDEARLNDKLAGVLTSVADETVSGRDGTGVSDRSGL